jgi:sortase (surface protein transpeptidase)
VIPPTDQANGGIGALPIPPARPRPRRVLAVVTLLVSLIGTALAVHQLLGSSSSEEVVLDVTRATLDSEQMEAIVRSTVPAASSVATPATLPLSPLASNLPKPFSALPAPISNAPVPVGLRIDSINLDNNNVIPVGVDDKGELAVPEVDEIGWYSLGQRPGETGATVLASHVSWKKQSGLFARLGKIEPGEEIFVTLSDGSERRYLAWERAMFDKTSLPYDRIWTREGNEVLVLITCGGEFNPEIRRYRQNIVIFAVPVPT